MSRKYSHQEISWLWGPGDALVLAEGTDRVEARRDLPASFWWEVDIALRLVAQSRGSYCLLQSILGAPEEVRPYFKVATAALPLQESCFGRTHQDSRRGSLFAPIVTDRIYH